MTSIAKLIDKTPFTQSGGKKPIPYTPPVEEWVKTVIKDSGISILAYDTSLLIEQLYLLGDLRIQKYSLTAIEAAISVISAETRQNKIADLRQTLKYSGKNELLSIYAKAIAKNYGPVEEAKIAHFIWQIKRKLFGLTVSDQMMLVLTGQQGGGKSISAEYQLCGPVHDHLYRTDFSVLEKPFSGPLYEENYILFFDELSKIKAADAEKLKSKITERCFMDRGFHSKKHIRYEQNCTFIGTSNESLVTQLIDPTGSRRFCEVETLPTDQFKQNHPILEGIDYTALWKGVDENSPSPIVSVKSLLSLEQEAKLTPTHHVRDFADDCLIADPTSFTLHRDIEEKYNDWLRVYRPRQFGCSRSWLIRYLVNFGFQTATQNGEKGLRVTFRPIKTGPHQSGHSYGY